MRECQERERKNGGGEGGKRECGRIEERGWGKEKENVGSELREI